MNRRSPSVVDMVGLFHLNSSTSWYRNLGSLFGRTWIGLRLFTGVNAEHGYVPPRRWFHYLQLGIL